jgi:recombination protein RecT
METQKTPMVIINESLEKIEKKFIELTNKETWEREKSYALQIFRKNPTLQKANVRSTLEAIVNVANIGLTLNPALKLAYLVPRFSSQGVEICLEASYQGLVKLITDTKSAKNVYCHLVYKGDEFQETLGTSVEIKHVPKRESYEIVLVYAVAVLYDGSKQVEVMDVSEINEIREKSESYKAVLSNKIKSCPWTANYGEMARKTVIRRLCKYLPKTDQWGKLANAIKLDEVDYTISDAQFDFIEQLLHSACISPEEKQLIESQMNGYSSIEANEVITRLKESQVDPIDSGQNYSQTDISKKIKQII